MLEEIKQRIQNPRVITALTLIVALGGVGGSFMLSLTGNTPCIYCWIARVSMIVVAILTASALYRENLWLHIISAVAILPALIASAILVRNDYFPDPICTEQVKYCFSPIFFGVHASLYALLFSVIILAGSVYSAYLTFSRSS